MNRSKNYTGNVAGPVTTTVARDVDSRTFGPLVETCVAHGISRTVAFELAASGMLETFAIGRRRYVLMESLRTLPDRMRAAQPAG